MDKLLKIGPLAFDTFRAFWYSEKIHKIVSSLLVIIFLATLGVIELNRQGFLPLFLVDQVPKSHYMAINLAFLLVLIIEILSMLLALPGSMSKALGKQFEILALIFLRNAFKELSVLPEPISLNHHNEVLWHILLYGFGAVAIFALLGLYTAMQKNIKKVLVSGPSLDRFIAAKKNVALCMLVTFFAMGTYNLVLIFMGQAIFSFFPSFYTVLIFSDILMVLLAQTFLPQFPAIFRNSGYALATLLIRLSLTTPVYFNVAIGLSSVLLAVFLTLVYNKYYTLNSQR